LIAKFSAFSKKTEKRFAWQAERYIFNIFIYIYIKNTFIHRCTRHFSARDTKGRNITQNLCCNLSYLTLIKNKNKMIYSVILSTVSLVEKYPLIVYII